MKKILFLTLFFLAASSITFARKNGEKKSDNATIQMSSKQTVAPINAGLCLAIFDLPCAYVFQFMDCVDMECVTDYGWSQMWNGYNRQFCSPLETINSPQTF